MTTPRPIFDPVDTTFDPSSHSAKDDVESPSLTSGNALARFEFEPGRSSKDGTKVLMVEWEEDETTKHISGDWELSWENKRTVLPAKDEAVNRLYFLLGPGVAVPTKVKLKKGEVVWRTNPLPAIFPPELGGKKGVMHTIWAKKRIQVLQKEIEREGKENSEGIGLEMAVAEKEWIEQNFGVVAKPANISIPSVGGGGGLGSPTSPRSPGGGRLMDKLKGLKLGTSSQELSQGHNPLSPESSDMAFGSFAQLKGSPPPSTLAAKPPQQPAQQRIVAQRPPESFQQRQQQAEGGMGSLNAFASGDMGGLSQPAGKQEDDEDDLFALPMSPRSPEMAKSPFSFATQDTMRYLRGERATS